MRNALLLGARVVVGGYLVVHGSQKLFGAFGGAGLDKTAAGFERIGLAPGRQMAILAGATELGGGLLTMTGVASPAGPLAIMGTMAVASATHRSNGPLARDGGFELPLTNLAAAAALAASGPGKFRTGPALGGKLTALGAAVGAVLATGALARMVSAQRAVDAVQASPPAAASPQQQADQQPAS